jgi:hypothetical protein
MPVPPGFRQVFPTAISTRARHLHRVSPVKLQWRSTCTGQRTKRRTRLRPSARCLFEPLTSGACASKSACGRRSLPRRPLDIRCRRCVRQQGRSPVADVPTDQGLRSDVVPRRTPPSRRPGCLPPLRPRELSVVNCSTTTPSRRSLAHAAHTFSPGWGKGAFTGLASTTVRSPAIRGIRETSAFVTRWTARAWD